MTKLIRCLNKHHNWLDYTNTNKLKIIDLTIEKRKASCERNNSEGIHTDYYEVNFNVVKGPIIISKIQQKLCLDVFKALDVKDTEFLHKTYQLLASFQELRFSQKTFMTYLNEEEALLFNQEVGDSILLTQKKYYTHHQLILVEEELSQVEAYVFKEDDF